MLGVAAVTVVMKYLYVGISLLLVTANLVANDGFVVENKHTPKLTEVKVFKIWDDDNDKNGDRPNGITVVLLKDGKAFRQAVLNEGNGWQHTFSDLKTAEAGKEIKYTIPVSYTHLTLPTIA